MNLGVDMEYRYIKYNGEEVEVGYTVDEDDHSCGYRSQGVVVEEVKWNNQNVTNLLSDCRDKIIKLIEQQIESESDLAAGL